MTLHTFGFDTWFEQQARQLAMEGSQLDMTGFQPGRVSAVDRGSLLLVTDTGEIPAEPSGRLVYGTQRPSDLPCVGDWVVARTHSGGTAAIVHAVLPRRSFLRRRTPGTDHGHQMIAANVDAALLVQSCHYDFNPARLERALVMAADGGVEPMVLLTKADLAAPEELEHLCTVARNVTGVSPLAVSCLTGQGMEELGALLRPGRTYCLVGSSGVGKSTLLNNLLGRALLDTGGVSSTGEGRHTTTRRQLLRLAGGALLIDTPGMRELGLAGAEGGLEAEFSDIALLAQGCRFADCRHEAEPGCAVRKALKAGDLAAERHAGFLKLRRESEFHALSVQERRERDRAFGKMVRTIKNKRD